MKAELGSVDVNLLKAERLAREALGRGAQWIVLPEFFTSAMAFHPSVADAVRRFDGAPAQLLRTLARAGHAYVGGSFLAWRDGNAYNSFILAQPDGSTHSHDKDFPSFWEACYYVGGKDDGVFATADGAVGAAVCYELVRTATAARLRGKVDLVLAGSCWWGVPDSTPADDPGLRWLSELLRATPGRFARLVGAPVVHAAHAGSFEGWSWPGRRTRFRSYYLGEAQIVNERGDVLARMSRTDGEGVITADVQLGPTRDRTDPIPDRFWIPEMPEAEDRAWREQLKEGFEFYSSQTLPSLHRRFDR